MRFWNKWHLDEVVVSLQRDVQVKARRVNCKSGQSVSVERPISLRLAKMLHASLPTKGEAIDISKLVRKVASLSETIAIELCYGQPDGDGPEEIFYGSDLYFLKMTYTKP